MVGKKCECAFSIVLSDRNAIKEINVKSGGREQAAIGGSIGELVAVNFLEGLVLHIQGKKGVIDIGLTKGELERMAFRERRRC